MDGFGRDKAPFAVGDGKTVTAGKGALYELAGALWRVADFGGLVKVKNYTICGMAGDWKAATWGMFFCE